MLVRPPEDSVTIQTLGFRNMEGGLEARGQRALTLSVRKGLKHGRPEGSGWTRRVSEANGYGTSKEWDGCMSTSGW